MSLKVSSALTALFACAFCCAANAQNVSAALAKVASENPKQPIIVGITLKRSTTQAMLAELTKNFAIDAMQVSARTFTKGGEGVLALVPLASEISDDRLLYQAKCAFGKPTGTFQYSPETVKLVQAELGDDHRWWFDGALLVTTAEEALRLAQNPPAMILQIVPYQKMPMERRDPLREEFKKALLSESCATEQQLSIH